MDGNNRWSKLNSYSKYTGYKTGADNLFKLSSYIFDNFDVNIISAFALSSSNLLRPNKDILTIKKVLNYSLDKILKQKINFKIEFIGNLRFLDKELKKKINEIKKLNLFIKNKKQLLIFINYSGQDDILRSVNRLTNSNLKVSKKNFSDNLYTKKIQDPDILIRSGGYIRLSNFMLFQLSFTELFFLKKLWPDLSTKDVKKIINKFSVIERKFGK